MRGWQRADYSFFGARTPWGRHVGRSRPQAEQQFLLFDDPVTEEDLAIVRERRGPSLELCVRRFLLSAEIRAVFQTKNRGKKGGDRIEYYDFLEWLRDELCVPAMRDCMAGTSLTVRSALQQRLQAAGLPITAEHRREEGRRDIRAP